MKSWNELKYSKQRIVSHKQIAEGAYILSFRRNFDFKAGQVIGLELARILHLDYTALPAPKMPK
jgi:hypothetical protein